MRKILRLLTIGLILGATSLGSHAAQAGTAILTDVSGNVQVTHGGAARGAATGTNLAAGDVVRVVSGAATIFYAGRGPQVLRAGQSVRVGAGGGGAQWRNVYASLSTGFDRRSEENRSFTRDRDVKIVAPFNTRIMEARPILRWQTVVDPTFKVADYLVTVSDADGKQIWQVASKENVLPYALTAPALQPSQTYTWKVEVRNVPTEGKEAGKLQIDDSRSSREATFQIAPPAETAAAQAEFKSLDTSLKTVPLNVRRLALAASLEKRGFYGAAIDFLTQVAPETIEAGHYYDKLDEVLPKLDNATRVLLRRLYLETKQFILVDKIDHPQPVKTGAAPSTVVGSIPATSQ